MKEIDVEPTRALGLVERGARPHELAAFVGSDHLAISSAITHEDLGCAIGDALVNALSTDPFRESVRARGAWCR